MAATPDPSYDLQGAITNLAAGLVLQRELLEAAAIQYAANNFTPLTAAQISAILEDANTLYIDQPAPRFAPTTFGGGVGYPNAPVPWSSVPLMPRFADSNPDPLDGWVEFGVMTAPMVS